MSVWVTAELADLATRDGITDGPFGSNLKTVHYTESGPRVIRLQNIGDAEFIDAEAHISDEHFERLRKHEAKAGDLAVALLGGDLPRACLVPPSVGPAIVKADCARVRIADEIASAKYVCFALNREGLRKEIAEIVHGVGRPRITLRELRALEIPLAPRAQQDRIVAAIEQQLSRVDAGVAALERVQKELARYRASVLKAACEGRLVPTEASLARAEGRSYEPASELLARILAERRAHWEASNAGRAKKYTEPAPPDDSALPEVPEGWVWASCGQLLSGIEAGASFKCEERPPHEGEIGVVKVSAVTWGNYDELESKTCNDLGRIDEAFIVRRGDFLFSRANTIELVGACVIAQRVTKRVMLSDKILRFSVLSGLSNWLLHVLRSSYGRSEIERLATGNQESMRNIGQERVRQIAIPLPPLPEQLRIVAEVERRLSIADEVAATVETALARAARLRQSILKRAFEGNLVPQDPNDEPASTLLARIHAEREKEQSAKVKKK